jgi:hypothetical protein
MNLPKSIQEELQRRVLENRQLGKYPVGLEEQLEADFKAIMEVVHGREGQLFIGEPEIAHLGQMIESLEKQITEIRLDKKINKSLKSDDAASSLIDLAESTCEALTKCLVIVQSMEAEVRKIREEDTRILRKINHTILDRLVMVDVLAQAVVDLERRFEEK